ncbi:MAG: DUF2249 domain-containing protein [Magnetococcales bacterium]|nr:DUF2249 domain-containing protein [Magnetococcales bacterium]
MQPTSEPTLVLDVRQHPPPQPMVLILEATAKLAPGSSLKVIHSRIPHPLYPRLQERGLLVETHEHADGTVELMIRRPL